LPRSVAAEARPVALSAETSSKPARPFTTPSPARHTLAAHAREPEWKPVRGHRESLSDTKENNDEEEGALPSRNRGRRAPRRGGGRREDRAAGGDDDHGRRQHVRVAARLGLDARRRQRVR